MLPEIATLRALLEDFLLRWEPDRDALLAWHHSFSDEYRDELRRARAAWDPADGPFMPPEPIPTKPRGVLDISNARLIIEAITKAVERVERIRMMQAIPLDELARVMAAMGDAVRTVVADPAQLARIAAQWDALPVRPHRFN